MRPRPLLKRLYSCIRRGFSTPKKSGDAKWYSLQTNLGFSTGFIGDGLFTPDARRGERPRLIVVQAPPGGYVTLSVAMSRSA